MFAWIRELTGQERKTLIATYGGWSVDAFDFMIYTFVIPTLMAAWGMTKGEAGMIATSALLMSALGGWIAGALSDRFGRVRMLQITIAWFAFFTLPLRLYRFVYGIAGRAQPAGPGFRRRVGGRLGHDR